MDAAKNISIPERRHVSTAVTQEKPNWMSSPESFVVDGIVAWLKNQSVWDDWWTRTGPSLRLLNKHWYHEINRHIDNFNWRPGLPEEAIHSLQKFPNLTSFHIEHVTSPKDSSLLPETVRKMPKLNHLSIPLEWLSRIMREDLEGLECKTVCVSPSDNQIEVVDAMIKLAAVRMEELQIDFSSNGWIARFLTAASSVKRLELRSVESEGDFEALAALDELKISYEGDNLQRLSMLTSLVSLTMNDVLIRSFESLVSLKKLKILHVMFADGYVFDRSFYEVTGRLKELDICGSLTSTRQVALPRDFWKAATGLEVLHIDRLVVDTSLLNQFDGARLQDLHLYICELRGGTIPWNRMTSLIVLHLHSVSADGTSDPYSTDLSPLRNLKELFVAFSGEADIHLQFLQSIKQLSKLEYLSLCHPDMRMELGDLKAIVESFKELSNMSEAGIDNLEDFLETVL